MNHPRILLFLLLFKSVILYAQDVDSVFSSNIVKNGLSEEFVDFIIQYDEYLINQIIENEQILVNKIERSEDAVVQCKLYASLAAVFWFKNKKDKLSLYYTKFDSVAIANSLPFGKIKKLQLDALQKMDRKDYSTFHFLLDSAIVIAEEQNQSVLIPAINYDFARIYWNKGDKSTALEYFKRAEQGFKEQNNWLRVGSIYYYYGSYYYFSGYLDFALDFTQKSEAVFKNFRIENQQIKALSLISRIYVKLRKFNDAARIQKEILNNIFDDGNDFNIARCYHSLSEIELDKGNFDSAEYFIAKATEYYQKVKSEMLLFEAELTLADIKFEKGLDFHYLETFKKGLEIYEKRKYPIGIASLYLRMAKFYLLKNDFINADSSIQKTLSISYKINNKELIRDAYSVLAQLKEKELRFEEALKFHRLFKEYSDSLLDENSMNRAAALKTYYELEKKQEQIRILKTEARFQKKRYQQLFLLVAIAILFFLLIVFFIRNLDRKKHIKELEKKNNQLEEARAKAEEANRLKTEFISNISHEIRTPVNAIQGFIELIDPETSKDELDKFLMIISKSSENLMKTVDDLMQISRINANQVKVKNRTFLLNYLLESVCSIANQKIAEKNKPIQIDKSFFKDIEITTDYTILITILTHLIDNSIKFTDFGKIEVSTSANYGYAKILISDSGIGFDMSKVNLITEEFYKINSNDKLYRGSGVGLSIASKLAKVIGAKLEIFSEPGQGTKAWLTLRKNG
jgi:signal transduction histidine kinase/tetratricopeptide (TPR) repeat protein